MNAKRKQVTVAIMLGFGAALILLPSPAQETKPEGAAPLTELAIVEKVRAATDKALDYMEQKQDPQTGSWSANHAINGLATLAFLSSGHMPGRGKYGDTATKPGVLTRSQKFILKSAQPTGFISSSSKGMYEHGLATLALAEMYGMDPDPDIEDKLRK